MAPNPSPQSGPGVVRTLDSISHFIRSLVAMVVAGVVGGGGYLAYNTYYSNEIALAQKEQQIAQLSADLAAKQQQIDRLATAVRLLKVDHRLAQIRFVRQEQEIPGDETSLKTTFQFVEVDDAGHELEQPRTFTVHGDEVWVQAWVVSFLDEFVEEGDSLRGTSICLFKSIFTKHKGSNDEFPLETVGSRPAAYSRGSEMSELERDLWGRFWELAMNKEQAEKAGVRVAFPQAVGARLRDGIRYTIELRSSGGLSVKPEDVPTVGGRLN